MSNRSRGSEGSPEKGSPEYNWLYGSQRSGRGGAQGQPPADPEPTRVMPTMNRPGDGPGDGRGGQPPVPPSERPRTSSRGSGSTPPPTKRSRRGRFGWVKLVLLLWLVFLIAVPIWAWAKIDKVDADPNGDRPEGQPGHTYLLVGSDSREGLSAEERKSLGTGKAEGRRTDTIMLLHTGSGPNLLLSIPRDSIVDVPGYGTEKVNAAYAYGGPKLLVKTLEGETGIAIDSYVEIGFAGFVNVVDAVGGIEICPKEKMKDKLANLDIPKGCQEADGPTALGYARSRHTSSLGDISRAQHQREVVSAVGKEAVSPWSVINPLRYFRLSSAGADSVRLGEDTGPFDTLRFAWAMTRVSGEEGLTCSVPIADLAVNWDPERAPKMFDLIKEDRTSDISKQLCKASGLAD